MDNGTHISFNAEDRSYFAILKKEIHNIAASAGFDGKRTGEVDIVVAEMTSNLLKHGGGGEILVRMMGSGDNAVIELISIDNGPGMSNAARMMEDGMSTSNTLGHGFGSMKRLSDTLEIYSLKDWGTIVLARLCKNEHKNFSKKPVAEVRTLVVAKPGETLSGDGAYFYMDNDYVKIFLGDGLGHGAEAHAAVQQAISGFAVSGNEMPVEILREMHVGVKRTRGLVGTVAIYYLKEKLWRICGIGNISTRMQINNTSSKNYMSYNGIIGMNVPTSLKEQEIPNDPGQVILMCSDGIKTRWDLQKYSGILKHDLTVLAAAIYKDYARKTDDMSVVAARINKRI